MVPTILPVIVHSMAGIFYFQSPRHTTTNAKRTGYSHPHTNLRGDERMKKNEIKLIQRF
jgi:hypothetical protein